MNHHAWLAGLTVLWLAGALAGCGLADPLSSATSTVAPLEESDSGAALPNPASAYCQEQGFELEIRTDPEGNQVGYCVFADGSECEEWAYFRGECAPSGMAATAAPEATPEATTAPAVGNEQPVEGWRGIIVALPEGSQFDDYFQLIDQESSRFGIDALDPQIAQELRDWRGNTGHVLRIWGTLHNNVPDAYGTQITVTRLEVEGDALVATPGADQDDGEPVDGWVGTIVKLPDGYQEGQYFLREDGVRYWIGAENDTTMEQISEYRWSGVRVQLWGRLYVGDPPAGGNGHIQAERIELVSD